MRGLGDEEAARGSLREGYNSSRAAVRDSSHVAREPSILYADPYQTHEYSEIKGGESSGPKIMLLIRISSLNDVVCTQCNQPTVQFLSRPTKALI